MQGATMPCTPSMEKYLASWRRWTGNTHTGTPGADRGLEQLGGHQVVIVAGRQHQGVTLGIQSFGQRRQRALSVATSALPR